MTEKRTPKPRAGKTTWTKGQSGNPGGRSPRVGPNGETVAQLARLHTADCIARMVQVLRGHDDDLALKAAQALLDRGWGKPKESMDLAADVKGSGLPVIQIVRVDADPG